MILHPDEWADALRRAEKAANRAGALPRWWVALPVEWGGRSYVVIFRLPHRAPPVAVYRVKPDLRLKRLERYPWQLGPIAWDMFGRFPVREVGQPGELEGWTMTSARLERFRG